jgi:hypothetical protein
MSKPGETILQGRVIYAVDWIRDGQRGWAHYNNRATAEKVKARLEATYPDTEYGLYELVEPEGGP